MVLKFDPEFGACLEEGPVLLVEADGLLVPFFTEPQGVKFRADDTALLKLKWIDDDKQARQICGLQVFVKQEDRIVEEGFGSIHDLIGFMLIDQAVGVIGQIEQVADYGGNLVIQLTFRGKEVLVPFHEDFLIHFDEEKKEIVMQCPGGIFDLE